mgnify:CR=1 FL=1
MLQMTGEKKIVGLWRESGGKCEKAAPPGQPPGAPPGKKTAEQEEVRAERDWLDMSTLAESEEVVVAADSESPASFRRDRILSALLLLTGAGWTLFALGVATNGFSVSPRLTEWPTLVATIATPVGLLVILWMVLLRSSRSEQARFTRVATALRAENAALNLSMRALANHLADAQRQLGEQARTVQQLGLDTVARLNDSSDKLAVNASVIANAHDQLSRSGDVAMQRMDGLLAGLPRIDDVAQRLAVNFREAGLVAHQQGANLEARLAALSEETGKAAQTGEAAAAALIEAIGTLQQQAKETGAELATTSAQITESQGIALARMTQAAATARDDLKSTIAAVTGQMDASWRQFREGVGAAAIGNVKHVCACH